jgi:hypothetical protein
MAFGFGSIAAGTLEVKFGCLRLGLRDNQHLCERLNHREANRFHAHLEFAGFVSHLEFAGFALQVGASPGFTSQNPA